MRGASRIAALAVLISASAALGAPDSTSWVEEPRQTPFFPGTFVWEASSNAQAQAAQMAERGTPAWDTLRGTGSRLGYYLGHGGVVPNSESVALAGTHLARGRDYYIDYESGSIVFARYVSPSDSISITYRYLPGKDTNRTAADIPGLSLNFGESWQSDFGASFLLGDKAGGSRFDSMICGTNGTLKLADSFTLDSVYYISTPQEDKARDMPVAKGQSAPEAPKSDHFALYSGAWNLGKMKFGGSLQDIGNDFTGFSALIDRKGIDAGRLGQLEKEKGLKRHSYDLAWAPTGATSFASSWAKIQEDDAAIDTRTLSLVTSRLDLSSTYRKISNEFTRFDNLAEGDRGAMKNQKGLTRNDIKGSYKVSPSTSLAFDYVMATDMTNGALRQRIDLKSPMVTGFATYRRVDAGFARSQHLALPYSKELDQAKGTRFWETGATLTPLRGLTLTNYQARMLASADDTRSSHTVNALAYNWGRTTLSTTLDETTRSFGSGAQDRSLLASYALQHTFANGWTLSGTSQRTDLSGFATPLDRRRLTQGNFSTTSRKKATLTAVYSEYVNELEQEDGKSDYTLAWSPLRNVSVRLNSLDIRNTLKGSHLTNSGHMEWAMPKGRRFALDAYKKIVDGQGMLECQSAAAEGALSKRTTLVGSFGVVLYTPEEDDNGNPIAQADRTESSKVTLVTSVGPAKISAGLVQTQSSQTLAELSRSVRLETPLGPNSFVFDYLGALDAADTVSASHLYQFVSDRDPNKRLHFDMLYKTKDFGAGDAQPLRNYNISYKFSEKMTASMSYYRNRENNKGQFDPVWGRTFKLNRTITPDIALVVDYAYLKDNQKHVLKNGISLQGKLSATDLISAGMDVDYLNQQYHRKTFTYRVTYDHQVNADRYLALSAVYLDRQYDDGGSPAGRGDEMQGRLDFKILFE
jgi:hypothetical protein